MSRSNTKNSRVRQSNIKRNASFWKAHVKAWQDSGLSRAEYCRRHDLSYGAMTYWHGKTKGTDCQTASGSIVPVLSIQPVELSSHSPIRIIFREQFTIEIDAEFDEAVLRKVVRALEG